MAMTPLFLGADVSSARISCNRLQGTVAAFCVLLQASGWAASDGLYSAVRCSLCSGSR